MEGIDMDISRRGMFGFLPGIGAAVVTVSKGGIAVAGAVQAEAPKAAVVTSFNWARVELFRRGVVAEVGADVFDSWFSSIEMEKLEHGKLTVSMPALFLKQWVDRHYAVALLRGAQRMDGSVEEVQIVLREPRVGRMAANRLG